MKWCFIVAVKQMCPRSLCIDLASCHSLLNTLLEYDTQKPLLLFLERASVWRLHCGVVLLENQGTLTRRDTCGTRTGRGIAWPWRGETG